uniref:Uncharacterized protein n=1 Tax=Oryctolagus cuniculus TaxID=9986 RepID=A0A5F9DEN8_RABIT
MWPLHGASGISQSRPPLKQDFLSRQPQASGHAPRDAGATAPGLPLKPETGYQELGAHARICQTCWEASARAALPCPLYPRKPMSTSGFLVPSALAVVTPGPEEPSSQPTSAGHSSE